MNFNIVQNFDGTLKKLACQHPVNTVIKATSFRHDVPILTLTSGARIRLMQPLNNLIAQDQKLVDWVIARMLSATDKRVDWRLDYQQSLDGQTQFIIEYKAVINNEVLTQKSSLCVWQALALAQANLCPTDYVLDGMVGAVNWTDEQINHIDKVEYELEGIALKYYANANYHERISRRFTEISTVMGNADAYETAIIEAASPDILQRTIDWVKSQTQPNDLVSFGTSGANTVDTEIINVMRNVEGRYLIGTIITADIAFRVMLRTIKSQKLDIEVEDKARLNLVLTDAPTRNSLCGFVGVWHYSDEPTRTPEQIIQENLNEYRTE